MAKKLVCILSVVLFSFAGCNGGGDASDTVPDTLSNRFSCVADIQYNGTQIKANVTSSAAGLYDIKIIEPSNLSGMTISWTGEEIKVGYMGLSFGVDPSTLPDSVFGTILIDVFNKAAMNEGISIEKGEEELVLKGESDSGEFYVTMDRATGAITHVSVPSAGFEAQFSEFSGGE